VENSRPKRLKPEAVIPLPASRRLSMVLGVSALLIMFTAFMDAALWGVFNAPLEQRRQAAKEYEVQSLRSSHRELAQEAYQLRQQVEMLSSALHSCTEREVESLPQIATPCRDDELRVRVDEGGPILCVTPSDGGLILDY